MMIDDSLSEGIEIVYQVLKVICNSRHFLNKRQPKLQARDSGIWWAKWKRKKKQIHYRNTNTKQMWNTFVISQDILKATFNFD